MGGIARNLGSTSKFNAIDATMPEIAEVERARTILEQILKDQTLVDVESVRLLPCTLTKVRRPDSLSGNHIPRLHKRPQR
jgi:formamidopyrimidine-DNA glycosylase